ncbi:site-specific integrase [Streptomyces acidicola]|uniref:site-specific integrase n=1 Tax=Streptomyces acidicola TaxID=2596892 RepID=UPI0038109478
MLGLNGRPDLRVKACLGSPKWRRLAWRTQRDYAYSLMVWLNYLLTMGVNWWEADDGVASEFLFWRVTDRANEDAVETRTFARDLAGLKKVYSRAARSRIADPFAELDAPCIVRHADVKWLDPSGYS